MEIFDFLLHNFKPNNSSVEWVVYSFEKKLNFWDEISKWAPILIAILAFFISAFQTLSTRKHNRLMARPHIDSLLHINDKSLAYDVTNNGIGPAILLSYEVYLDGEKVKSNSPLADAVDAVLENYPYTSYQLHAMVINSYIPAGTTIKLATIIAYKPDYLSEIIGQRIRILATYCSIYKEKFTFDSSAGNLTIQGQVSDSFR